MESTTTIAAPIGSGDTTGTIILGGGVALAFFFLAMVLLVFMIICYWRIFTKAGKPGWAAIIPIYNVIVMLEIIDRPIWWILLMLLPFVNFVISIIIMLDLAEAYGKSTVFAIFGLILFPYIGYAMLAFGSAQYVGRSGGDKSNQVTPPASPSTPATV